NLLLRSCIDKGLDFVIDNTNPTKAERAVYISMAKAAGYRVIGYFFESRLQDCIKRNEQRTGKAKIPAKAIAATSNKLELPSRDEGFDELYFVGRSGSTLMMKSEWRD
ncbi:MAG: AAA family ATPase, partial [Synergistes sp.]|nr:AAA family ATPase [Synergistes sp.]